MAIPSNVVYYVGYEQLKKRLEVKLEPYNKSIYAPVIAGSLSRGTLLFVNFIKHLLKYWKNKPSL